MNINEHLADFKRRYEQSYIWVAPPESTEESLFFVNRISEDKCNIANLELSSPEFGKIILNMGTSHTLKFKYPPVGVFQNGTDAYMFRRLPAKQYKHGLYGGNSTINKVSDTLTRSAALAGNKLDFTEVLSAFRGEVYSFKDALKMLGSGKYRSVAMPRNYSMMLSITADPEYILLFWEVPIARIDAKGNVTSWFEKSFESVLEQIKGT